MLRQGKARGKAAGGAAAPRLHEELLAERVNADTPPADRLDAEVLRCSAVSKLFLSLFDVIRAQSASLSSAGCSSEATLPRKQRACNQFGQPSDP